MTGRCQAAINLPKAFVTPTPSSYFSDHNIIIVLFPASYIPQLNPATSIASAIQSIRLLVVGVASCSTIDSLNLGWHWINNSCNLIWVIGNPIPLLLNCSKKCGICCAMGRAVLDAVLHSPSDTSMFNGVEVWGAGGPLKKVTVNSKILQNSSSIFCTVSWSTILL